MLGAAETPPPAQSVRWLKLHSTFASQLAKVLGGSTFGYVRPRFFKVFVAELRLLSKGLAADSTPPLSSFPTA